MILPILLILLNLHRRRTQGVTANRERGPLVKIFFVNNKAKNNNHNNQNLLVFFLVTMVLAGYMGVSGFIPAVAPQVAHAAFNAD